MAKIKQLGGGSSVVYKAAKLTKYSRAMCGKFKMYFPREPELLDAYRELMEGYEQVSQDLDGWGLVAVNDEQLEAIEHYEKLTHLFLTDVDYCGLPEDHEAVKELMPTKSSLIHMVRTLDKGIEQ